MEMLILLLFFGVSFSVGFNVSKPEQLSGNGKEFFGYRVLEYQSDEMKQIIISSPLSGNRSEANFMCTVHKRISSHFYQPDSKASRFFWMSMTVKTSPSATLTSCSQSLTHKCNKNGICYQFNSSLNMNTHNAGFQECKKSKVNLVFLFDGSSSMTTSDFNKNKEFIWNIMTTLQNSSVKFAAVQFSTTFRTVFTFKDYVSGSAKKRLDDEVHMKALTNTHRAVHFTLDNLFNNEESGADPEATKALVIITDGSPSDIDSNNVMHRCEELNIARFIIGVGGQVRLERLEKFASEPKVNNIYMINNYAGLDGLVDKLQNKIYGIEGARASEFRKEPSQRGVSDANDQACSPTLTPECDGNLYLNGICYQLNSRLSMESNFTTVFQDCLKSRVNLVFLVDGSSSMTTTDFNKNKEFIWNIVTMLKNAYTKFAAVQFSKTFRTVFSFKDYVNGVARERLYEETHMKALTHTHGAIQFTLDNLFNNEESGADPEATKALVIITDGAPSDIDNNNVIQRCEEQNIARLVIGVGHVKLERLEKFASEPKSNNIYMINNYDGLSGLLDQLQIKINGIEGGWGSEFTKELSQSRFDAASDKVYCHQCYGSYNTAKAMK